MRSLADQTETELGGRWSILARQKRDHVRLDRLLQELEALPPRADAQAATLQSIARLVFPHAFAEEAVVWPVARRVLPDGEALTLQVETEHQDVNELWARLEEGVDMEARRATVARLVEVLREDVRDEEDELLPRLQERLGVAQLRALGVAWETVRRTAPTRPHPVVARRPPGNALAALPLTVLDRSRDAIDAAARRGPLAAAPVLARTSGGLAAVAGRVETWEPLRRGERGRTRVED